jgi:hypothetical protein
VAAEMIVQVVVAGLIQMMLWLPSVMQKNVILMIETLQVAAVAVAQTIEVEQMTIDLLIVQVVVVQIQIGIVQMM